ncbi:MAG: MFS transporter [Kiritimatiellae bacterium]|nr:MFS transporter [Kiritimatiellia bacterium]
MSIHPTVTAEYERLVEQDYRRNLTAIVSWEFLWGLGLPFALFSTFIPAYLGAMNAPKALIGFILSFPPIFSAGQILMSYLIPAKKRLAIYRVVITVSTVPWLMYSVAAFFWGHTWPHWFHFAAFTLVQIMFIGTCYLLTSVYWEIMTDNIPPRKRGRLFGLRMLGIGLPVLLTGYVAARVLAHWEPPRNFQMAFVIGTAVYILSCAMLWKIRDHINPEHECPSDHSAVPFGRYLQNTFRALWQDPNYRIFIFFMFLLSMAINCAPFMVDAARTQLHVSSQAQGGFSIAFLIASMCLGWLIGLLADRFGYRLIGGVIGGMMASAFLICLVAHRVEWWYVAYGIYAVAANSILMLLCNMSAELCPQEPPNRLVAIGNILMAGFVMLATTLSGWVVDQVGSYQPIFIANLILSLVVVMGFGFIVREPRSGRLYTLTIAPHN